MNNFEIHNRADALSMAKDYMDRQQEIAAEFAKMAFNAALSSSTVNANKWQDYLPKMYTLGELTKKAQEMYSFAMNNKHNKPNENQAPKGFDN